MKRWKLCIIGYGVIGAGCFYLANIYQLTKFGGLISCGLKRLFKNAPCHVLLLMPSQIWEKYKNFDILRMEYSFSMKRKNGLISKV